MGEENILSASEQLTMIRSIEQLRLSNLTLSDTLTKLEKRIYELEIEVHNFTTIKKSVTFVLSIVGGGSGLLTVMYWIANHATR